MNSLDIQQQLADQRRGRYVRVSDVDRRLLIDTYKKGEDFIALAKKLNIKRSTARSILRTYIDEGRISAKQRAGTRLRFITEDEAQMIRDMKRRHPLITIGQIQMRLQRTSNRVLSKASISRILTNSIRLGKRAKRSIDGNDDHDGMADSMINSQDELMQLSSDENTGGAIFIDETNDDEDDDEETMMDNHSSLQNLDDFQRFMLRKTSINGDDSSMVNDGLEHYNENAYANNYPQYGSEEDEDELSDENETSTPVDLRSEITSTASVNNGSAPILNENGCWNLSTNSIKPEPVCVFVNRNYDENSSDSEQVQDQPLTIDEDANNNNNSNQQETPSGLSNAKSSTNHRPIKCCPLCGEKNFTRLPQHLAIVHNLDRQEIGTLLAYTDQNNNNDAHPPSMVSVSSSSRADTPSSMHLDKSPQPTPISINTNNQQITCSSSPTSESDATQTKNGSTLTKTTLSVNGSVSPNDQQSSTGLPLDGKKRLLCPRCDTWVLNLTDHLIKKHHLVSKQERLPFLRLARNRYVTPSPSTPTMVVNGTDDQTPSNAFLISPDHSSPSSHPTNEQQQKQFPNHRQYQSIVKKYRKKFLTSGSSSNLMREKSNCFDQSALSLTNHELTTGSLASTLPTLANPNLLTMNSIQTFLNQHNVQNAGKSDKFKFPMLNETYANRSFSAVKSSMNKDLSQLSTHQKFEQRLTVFRQQFAVTLAMQNSLMQQMELLQRSFVCIEDEWNDMKKQISA